MTDDLKRAKLERARALVLEAKGLVHDVVFSGDPKARSGWLHSYGFVAEQDLKRVSFAVERVIQVVGRDRPLPPAERVG